MDKVTGKVPVSFFRAQRIYFNVEWKALLVGSTANDVEFYYPEVHLVGSTEPEGMT